VPATAIALTLIIAALLTSTLSGILGMGGGVTLLGVMAIVLPPAQVVPLHGVVQLFSNSTRTAVFIRHVAWRLVIPYVPALVLGTWLATLVWSGDRLDWFRPGIGVFVLSFLVWRRRAPTLRAMPVYAYPILGVAAGFISVFVGATGPFIAPFFLRDDLEKEEVIATKAICQSATHLLKVPAFFSLGFDYTLHVELLAILTVTVIVGTVIGKKLLSKLSGDTFVRLFEIVLAAIALYLIASPFV
jgi:uncharacterized membrane protein YfcA